MLDCGQKTGSIWNVSMQCNVGKWLKIKKSRKIGTGLLCRLCLAKARVAVVYFFIPTSPLTGTLLNYHSQELHSWLVLIDDCAKFVLDCVQKSGAIWNVSMQCNVSEWLKIKKSRKIGIGLLCGLRPFKASVLGSKPRRLTIF